VRRSALVRLTEGSGFWGMVGIVNDNFGLVGYSIVGTFVVI
jgi:hypothetical protein